METNPLKNKPVITKKRTEKHVEVKEDYNHHGYRYKRRVEGGWEVWNEDGLVDRKEFLPDITDFEEVVLDPGGELGLSGKGVTSLDQISQWFNDRELASIRKLILRNNKIKSLKGLSKFPNLQLLDVTANQLQTFEGLEEVKKLRTLVADDNQITVYPDKDLAKKVEKISLKNNPIQSHGEVGNVLTDEFHCSSCGVEITKDEAEAYEIENQPKCLKCYKNIKEHEAITKKQSAPKPEPVIEDKKGNCFIATATLETENHPVLDELRSLRDNWMSTQWWGKYFIGVYYRLGRYPAKLIANNSILRKLSLYFIVMPLFRLSKRIKK